MPKPTGPEMIIGDYSREQHERICQLEAVLKTTIKMMKRGDESSLAFGVSVAEDAIERDHVYHISYPQWLQQVRRTP